jgi:hypothetical protein
MVHIDRMFMIGCQVVKDSFDEVRAVVQKKGKGKMPNLDYLHDWEITGIEVLKSGSSQ